MGERLILRTRPTTVEARQLSEDNAEDLAFWCGGWTLNAGRVRWFSREHDSALEARPGDWIVRSAFGHFVRVSDHNLLATYDRVLPAVSE